jgi:hypothetical protein
MNGLVNIVDGFCYDLFLRPSPTEYYTLAAGQMEVFRRAQSYRPRWYTVPDADQVMDLAAYQTVEEQVRILAGSFLWGISASVLDPNTLMQVNPASRLAVKITEGGTGIPLTWDFISAYQYWAKRPYAAVARAFPHRPILLSQPRLILEPGYLNVEMANTTTGNLIKAQLLLLAMEPCILIQDDYTECHPDPRALGRRVNT